MIKTKSVYDDIDFANDGTRILVSRKWPRAANLTSLSSWEKDLSPSKGLQSEWKAKVITWGQYKDQFIEEMKLQSNLLLQMAERSMRGEVITLLCFEPENDPKCHRHILKVLISEIDPDDIRPVRTEKDTKDITRPKRTTG